jgi:galactokinase
VIAVRAPGRVNLIGDHTDYNEGFVLPMAIDLASVVEGERRDDGVVRLQSRDYHAAVELPADGSIDPPSVAGWGNYAAGVIRSLAERGRPAVGLDATISSTVPIGSGLSSSAAHSVSVALALCHSAAFELPPLELALAARHAERIASGVPLGIMDQLASVAGRAEHALLIDCRSLEVTPVPLPPELAVLAVHSGMPRVLADSAYAERRAACEAAAARLGLPSLRDATPGQVTDDPKARHVVSENARVLEAARALEAGDLAALGPLLAASHASLRDDYEVSTPELDALVAALEDAGALGARLTGAGFGGCVVALARLGEADALLERAVERYSDETGLQPTAYRFRAVDGAGTAGGQSTP